MVKRLSFYSLRLRLILLVLVGVIPALGLLLHTAWENRRQAASEIQNQVVRLADLAARQERQLMEGTRHTLITMSQFLLLHPGDPAICQAFSARLLGQYRYLTDLGAMRPDGDLLFRVAPRHDLSERPSPLWVNEAIDARGFTLEEYHLRSIPGKSALVGAYPVFDFAGETLAVVFAEFNQNWLNRLSTDIRQQLPRESNLTLVDYKGVILAHYPDSGQWADKSMPKGVLFDTVLRQKRGLVEAPGLDGLERLHGFMPIVGTIRTRTVYLIFSIPKKTAFAQPNRTLIRNLVGLGIVALLALIAAWFGGEVFVLRRVRALANAAKRLKQGELNSRTGMSHGRSELDELSRVFDEMAVALEQRESERQQAEEQLRRSREELRNLSVYLQTAREAERTRISREIHDVLGQQLTALKMDLSWLRKHLNQAQVLPLVEKVHTMSRLIDTTIEDVQRISTELRPGLLDDLGLKAAIEWEADEFSNRTGIPCNVVFSPDDILLDKDLSTTIFRILQEALTNIMRHANATNVDVRLEKQNGKIVLEVRDDGKGIKETDISSPRSIGLIGIRERVRSWGGEVDIVGFQNKGTSVTVSIPADKKEKRNG